MRFFVNRMVVKDFPTPIIVLAVKDHEFHFIPWSQVIEVFIIISGDLPASRAFQIHDFDDLFRNFINRQRASRLQHDVVILFQ